MVVFPLGAKITLVGRFAQGTDPARTKFFPTNNVLRKLRIFMCGELNQWRKRYPNHAIEREIQDKVHRRKWNVVGGPESWPATETKEYWEVDERLWLRTVGVQHRDKEFSICLHIQHHWAYMLFLRVVLWNRQGTYDCGNKLLVHLDLDPVAESFLLSQIDPLKGEAANVHSLAMSHAYLVAFQNQHMPLRATLFRPSVPTVVPTPFRWWTVIPCDPLCPYETSQKELWQVGTTLVHASDGEFVSSLMSLPTGGSEVRAKKRSFDDMQQEDGVDPTLVMDALGNVWTPSQLQQREEDAKKQKVQDSQTAGRVPKKPAKAMSQSKKAVAERQIAKDPNQSRIQSFFVVKGPDKGKD